MFLVSIGPWSYKSKALHTWSEIRCTSANCFFFLHSAHPLTFFFESILRRRLIWFFQWIGSARHFVLNSKIRSEHTDGNHVKPGRILSRWHFASVPTVWPIWEIRPGSCPCGVCVCAWEMPIGFSAMKLNRWMMRRSALIWMFRGWINSADKPDKHYPTERYNAFRSSGAAATETNVESKKKINISNNQHQHRHTDTHTLPHCENGHDNRQR